MEQSEIEREQLKMFLVGYFAGLESSIGSSEVTELAMDQALVSYEELVVPYQRKAA